MYDELKINDLTIALWDTDMQLYQIEVQGEMYRIRKDALYEALNNALIKLQEKYIGH